MNDSSIPPSSPSVQIVYIRANAEGQRIDNFLLTLLKGVPKSRIYRLLRKGEIRINKKRVRPDYRLELRDELRIPPIRQPEQRRREPSEYAQALLANNILYEDDHIVVINKPAGLAVHAGSGVMFGVIEIMRMLRPDAEFIELVHRLDKETSGCLVLAKDRPTLLYLHALFKTGNLEKSYLALVHGQWPTRLTKVNLPLIKNQPHSGERYVHYNEELGKPALTNFKVVRRFADVTLVEANPKTGRTHQIRVHTSQSGFPIVGDEKYGKRELDKLLRQMGAKGMFLHSSSISFQMPEQRQPLKVTAPMPEGWKTVFDLLPVVENVTY
jgi:23S rRNA pseudouridine955/2504/2580 synthase